MTRRVFSGSQVLDGTGSAAAPADVAGEAGPGVGGGPRPGGAGGAVEAGRVVEVGPGLDGDEVVDCTGATVLPGLFDCHVHVMMSGVDTLRQLQTPFNFGFYQALHTLRPILALGITSVRDAGGADLGVAEAVRSGLIAGPGMQIAISMLSQTGGHGDGGHVCGAALPIFAPHPGRPATVVDGPDEMR